MIIVALTVYGLCLGSFVNALVWRIHAQSNQQGEKRLNKRLDDGLSITKGRSMCPNCRHQLTARDLIPVLSWVSLKGKCRYCKKSISWQYPLVELTTAILFVASYSFWPEPFTPVQSLMFLLWLLLVTGFMALVVYDVRWMLLPTRLIYPMGVIAALFAVLRIIDTENPVGTFVNTLFATAIGGGIFYILYQISDGKWIGGGDIRLGWILGALVGTPVLSFMVIFIASLLGCIFALPSLLSRKLKASSEIPFGPFLIAGMIIVFFFGLNILEWYKRTLLIS